MRIAVCIFRDEEIVADQQRRDQRAGGNVERLEQEGAHDEGDDERLNDHLDRFPPAFLFDRRPGAGGAFDDFGITHVTMPFWLGRALGATAPARRLSIDARPARQAAAYVKSLLRAQRSKPARSAADANTATVGEPPPCGWLLPARPRPPKGFSRFVPFQCGAGR